MDELITKLDEYNQYEKFAVLIGIIALYGDGEFSEPEQRVLLDFLRKTKFEPSTLVLSDPEDENQCLIDKLEWFVEFWQDIEDLIDVSTPDEIEDLYEKVCKDILIPKGLSDIQGQVDFNDLVKKYVKKLIKADGEVSEREKKLLQITKKTMGDTLVGNLITYGLALVCMYPFYLLFKWIFF